jgi:hypothetical protein
MRGKGKKKAMGIKKAKGNDFANTAFGKKVMKKKQTRAKKKG